MTQILGKFYDTAGATLAGKLRVTLSGNLIDTSTNPDSIYLPIPSIFTITSGSLDIELGESETNHLTYKFELFKVDTDGNIIEPALLIFDAVVPNIATVQFSLLVPTGMVNDVLATGALRIAQLIATDPNLSANIGGPFPKGDFNINTTYKYRDMVIYLSRAYISKSINSITGILPTNTTYWMRIPVEPNGSLILGDDTPYGSAWSGSGKSASQAEVYSKVEGVVTLVNQKSNSSTPSFSGVASFNNTLKVNPVSTFIPGTFNPGLDIQSANASRSVIRFSNNVGLARWELFKSEEPESGSNAGSNLTINSFADDGSFIGYCLSINRASRTVNVVNPSSDDNSTRVATTSWTKTLTSTLAPINNAVLTGTPQAPTVTDPFDNSNRIATTKHVKDILTYYAPTYNSIFYGDTLFSGPSVTFNNAVLAKKTVVINQNLTNNTAIDLQTPSATTSSISYSNQAGLRRWELSKTLDGETGSNAGSNFIINRFDDSGNYINWAFLINRNNGTVSFNGSQVVSYCPVVVSNSTASTNPGNGALIVNGGLGVIGAANIGGNLSATGSIYTSKFITDITTGPGSSSTGIPGQIILDTGYIYICTGVNQWRRATLNTY